jgi:hypothetical protein
MRRALGTGDVVAIVDSALPQLRREGYPDVQSHLACEVVTTEMGAYNSISRGRRVLTLTTAWGTVLVWPSQVRLYHGAAERFHHRDVELTAKVQAMKDARMAAKNRKVKP